MKIFKKIIFLIILITINSCSSEDGMHKAPLWIITGWETVDRYHQNREYWDEGDLYAKNHSFRGVSSNNSHGLIIVGQDGNIWQSSDAGLTWDNRTSGNVNTTRLWEVAFISGNYVAVGHDGVIITSTDGITWDNRTSGVTKHLRGIAFGNSTYVTVGQTGTILSSSDSISWTSRTSGTTSYLYGVSYLNDKFIAVGNSGILLTSTDGITWSSKSSGISTQLKEVSYGNGIYVAVGTGGTIISSTDTETWTSREGVDSSDALWAIEFGNGTFLTGGTNTYRSYDGITWENISSKSVQAIKYIDYETKKWKILGRVPVEGGLSCKFCQGF